MFKDRLVLKMPSGVEGAKRLKSFSVAKIRHLGHFIKLTLSENKPNTVMLHNRF